MRAHVSLPKELVEEIDELAGPRKRSEFIEEAVRLKLLNERQKRAIKKYEESGGLKGDYPHWSTPEKTSRWVHDLRRQEAEHRRRKLERPSS